MTTNKYCQVLAELRNRRAHYLKDVGDQWRSPDLLVWGINAMFGPLVLDLFADDDNTKCPAWYTAEDNALTHAGVWEDDSQVKRMLVEWGPVVPKGRVEITISRYEPAGAAA
ncbi:MULTISPECIES: DNA N-6-adenine-methyltransferase [Citrobacter]|uniref:DNA N-6-adenine-methyltransferase n=1 Tax=Citrobacter TaxID=544 RepID=UPI00073535B5|nr:MULTISPECIES: DNA N-6-adenine-methyltransferase [Citrobacter]MDU7329849.1 DNA N-6-adenine-methyltransferase [Klebsiella pneumoniae]OFV13482.1 hypothetical protein HMPREF3126_10995 [Salmonella sp. HMSC13B08]DAU76036.1 MAG TPA: Endodeoxyribonuclease RusA [Caudoviricetes sp.]KXA01065.1 phage N-6-adenine-methyltransferase-like protein [Citrobacter koseri]KXA06707.1 phage N-6-adenine-methyltransferase-like protein [Citrobacter koseri]